MPDPNDFEDDEEFPVLTEVVKEGDPLLIEAAQHARDEIEAFTFDAPTIPTLTPAALSRSITSPDINESTAAMPSRGATSLPLSEAQLQHLINEIIERHAEQMRNELYTILKHREE